MYSYNEGFINNGKLLYIDKWFAIWIIYLLLISFYIIIFSFPSKPFIVFLFNYNSNTIQLSWSQNVLSSIPLIIVGFSNLLITKNYIYLHLGQ